MCECCSQPTSEKCCWRGSLCLLGGHRAAFPSGALGWQQCQLGGTATLSLAERGDSPEDVKLKPQSYMGGLNPEKGPGLHDATQVPLRHVLQDLEADPLSP